MQCLYPPGACYKNHIKAWSHQLLEGAQEPHRYGPKTTTIHHIPGLNNGRPCAPREACQDWGGPSLNPDCSTASLIFEGNSTEDEYRRTWQCCALVLTRNEHHGQCDVRIASYCSIWRLFNLSFLDGKFYSMVLDLRENFDQLLKQTNMALHRF